MQVETTCAGTAREQVARAQWAQLAITKPENDEHARDRVCLLSCSQSPFFPFRELALTGKVLSEGLQSDQEEVTRGERDKRQRRHRLAGPSPCSYGSPQPHRAT